MTSDRDRDIKSFLKDAGWAGAETTPVPGDASARRYFRVRKGADNAVLMDVPMDLLSPECPEGASVEQRREAGYNALARVAGINPSAFVCALGKTSTNVEKTT